MVQQNCEEETTNVENPPPRREQTVWSEDLSEELPGETGEPQPTESGDDAGAWNDFWPRFLEEIHKIHSIERKTSQRETFGLEGD